MKITRIVRAAPLGMALLLCVAAANAQVYKWVDAKGVTHFSDTPPAQKQAEVKPYRGAGAAAPALPYELARAARSAPVTLYTTAQCKACDQGRKLLQARGIPFSEKTITTAADQAKLKEAGSEGLVPLLLVGRSKLSGFQPDTWNSALTNASYPATSMLPARYRNPDPAAAAPVAPLPSPEILAREEARVKEEAEAEAAAVRERKAPARKTSDAPEFQF